MTREERIRLKAYDWWQFRKANGGKDDPKENWRMAEHIVDAEDKVAMMKEGQDVEGNPC